MNTSDFNKLKPGDRVEHFRYGPCVVEKFIPDFGAVVQPTVEDGKKQLQSDSGAKYNTPLLEDDPKCLSLEEDLLEIRQPRKEIFYSEAEVTSILSAFYWHLRHNNVEGDKLLARGIPQWWEKNKKP